MDTLTVNQRNKTEVIAIVQQIPAIFRQALKIIAVRESDGLYDCCAKVTEDCSTWRDFSLCLANHAEDHDNHLFHESYLQRLWTLQE